MAILIVDDEKQIRQVVRRVLEREHAVVEAESADEARQMIATHRVELVLCDIGMSGESGLELVRTIAASSTDIAVVMVTGVDDPQIAAEAIDMGVYGYLVKPFTPNEIRITVASALRRRELEQSRTRLEEQRRELHLLIDRERIARDLHDTVIQRLFATGLWLQGASSLITDQAARERVEKAVDELDATIRQIRTTIFEMESSKTDRPASVRASVVEVARAAAAALGFEPTVVFTGAVDSLIPATVVDELLATLRESLSNVVRHALAHRVEIDLAVDRDISLSVRDDGVGIADAGGLGPGGLGIANMRTRAERLGGRFTVQRNHMGGTQVEWRIPLVAPKP